MRNILHAGSQVTTASTRQQSTLTNIRKNFSMANSKLHGSNLGQGHRLGFQISNNRRLANKIPGPGQKLYSVVPPNMNMNGRKGGCKVESRPEGRLLVPVQVRYS